MKVLLINTYPDGGGAAVSCRRLLSALRAIGVEARMLTAIPPEGEHIEHLASLYNGKVGRLRWKLDFLSERLSLLPYVGADRARLFRFSPDRYGVDILRHPWVEWADVIHLHWVQHAFVSLHGIALLLEVGKPLFWSLHDFWPIMGGCHIPYTYDGGRVAFCEHYLSGCDKCPLLKHSSLSSRQFLVKSRLPYDHIHFIAVSHAVAEVVKRSPLSCHSQVSVLPNMVDPDLFVPKTLPGRDTILFVAARPDDPVKGLELCRQALTEACRLSETFAARARFVCVGTPKSHALFDGFPIPVERVGAVSSSTDLARLYAEARVTLSTSLFETFGQTVLESIACGTPAVAFAVGGLTDIIQDGTNGVLVPPYDTNEMAKNLVALIEQPGLLSDSDAISATATPFHDHAVARRMAALYGALV